MGINWETGEIDHEQHVLDAEQLTPTIDDMEYFQAAYVEAEALMADPQGGLWLDPAAIIYSEEDVDTLKENNLLCRVIRLEEGYVVDASAGDYRLNDESEDTVDTDPDVDFSGKGWIPAIELIGDDSERSALEKLLFEKHNIVLNPSALLPAADEEASEISGPGEEEVS